MIDWILKRTTERRRGIAWLGEEVLEDIDYADDLGLLSETYEDMQEKTVKLGREAKSVGLKISIGKTKIMRINADRQDPVMLEGSVLENVSQFTYGTRLVELQNSKEAISPNWLAQI